MTLRAITLRRVRLPLVAPYRLSYRTFQEFEPIIVEAVDDQGRVGWGEGHISPGSSAETREGGWAFAIDTARHMVGQTVEQAGNDVLSRFEDSKVAATALVTALEMLDGHPLLRVDTETRLPLLTPFNATDTGAIAAEAESRVDAGFRTIKVKVGKNVADDLDRVAAIQRHVAGRAELRLDANRAYSLEQALAFVAGLKPDGIVLFEQPCDADDWEANAAVAAASPVPLMLDEPICAPADIGRAGTIDGVGFCKLKLKRFGGLNRLADGLRRVRGQGMQPVLGDGLAGDIGCWMEACVARHTIDNAGEFNGFLKPRDSLLRNPLPFADGTLILPADYRPEVDRDKLARHTVEEVNFQA